MATERKGGLSYIVPRKDQMGVGIFDLSCVHKQWNWESFPKKNLIKLIDKIDKIHSEAFGLIGE